MLKLKQNRGITLIALVITIIVILILVAVTINMVVNGGLFGYAGSAVSQTKTARDEEQNLSNIESGLTTDQLIAKFTSQSVTNPYASETPAYTWACDTSGNWSEAIGSETSGILARAYAKGTVTPEGQTEGTAYHLVIEPVTVREEGEIMGGLASSNKQNESYKFAFESAIIVDRGQFLLAKSVGPSKAWHQLSSGGRVSDYITKVIICDGINNIANKAFEGCDSLTSVTISNSVVHLGESAFYNCVSLTSITYKGTKTEWENVIKSSHWRGTISTINCSDGVIGY